MTVSGLGNVALSLVVKRATKVVLVVEFNGLVMFNYTRFNQHLQHFMRILLNLVDLPMHASHDMSLFYSVKF